MRQQEDKGNNRRSVLTSRLRLSKTSVIELLKDRRSRTCMSSVVFLVILTTVILIINYSIKPGHVDDTDNAPKMKALDLYRNWYNGDGTYYGSEGEGTCQIYSGDLPPAARNSRYLAALNKRQFLGSAACGMCFRVHGQGKGKGLNPITGDFIVFIKDMCPECKEGDVDLAVDGDGRWAIRIQAVQCPVGNTSVQYWIQSSNDWYVKLQVRNTRVPCMKVEVRTEDGSWVSLDPTIDGHWQGSVQLDQAGNIQVRLTAITGLMLDDIIPRMENQAVMEGKKHVQFPVNVSLPNAAKSKSQQR